MTHVVYFAADRYLSAEEAKKIIQELGGCGLEDACTELVTCEEDLSALPATGNEVLVAVPLTGAMQPLLLKAAERYSQTVLFAVYSEGETLCAFQQTALAANAAPAIMDVWAVLKRSSGVQLALNREQLQQYVTAAKAACEIPGTRLLLIGSPEPWVLSPERDMSVYEQCFGITIEQVSQQEVLERYAAMDEKQGRVYDAYFREHAVSVVEPSDADIRNAAKMAAVLDGLLKEHNAAGIAIACFNLLCSGTTMCLAVSYLNGMQGRFAACEGDIDSACTMMLLSRLTPYRPWMANPMVRANGTIVYSHCTAPIAPIPGMQSPFILRSHHESGIGVSVQVELPSEKTITICRLAAAEKRLFIQTGTAWQGERLRCCRTQLYVRPQNFEAYIENCPGCHQVLVYQDIADSLRWLGKQFGLTVD